MVNLTNEEIEDLIKKLEKYADNSHGPRRHEEVRGLIDICRTELDERDLVHCLAEAGLIVGITNVDVISENDVPKEDWDDLREGCRGRYPFLKVIYRSKSGVVLMLDSLEDKLKDFDDEGLTALQYELDMFREDFDDFLTYEQVEWFNQMYDIVSSELDARWLLKKLEERRIVKIERDA